MRLAISTRWLHTGHSGIQDLVLSVSSLVRAMRKIFPSNLFKSATDEGKKSIASQNNIYLYGFKLKLQIKRDLNFA